MNRGTLKSPGRPPRVLVVDDSAVARQAYRLLLAPEDGFDLVGTAPNAAIARRKLAELRPDVVVLDLEMPEEDGLSLLQWMMRELPVPVVVSSSYSPRGAEQTLLAFTLGAVEVICKDGGGMTSNIDAFGMALREAVLAAARARRPRQAPPPPPARTLIPAPLAGRLPRRGHCVVMGASTGGTEALAALVARMPADFPPTFIVQHMPPLYTRTFAKRLDSLGEVRVREAEDGATIGPGEVLIAPGGMQMRMNAGPTGPVACVRREERINRHAPSVDVLFASAVEAYRSRVMGVLLTGMGSDGAEGLLRIRSAGGRTIAQDEASCVVYGMPQEAVKRGAAQAVLPLERVLPQLTDWLAEA